MGELYRLDFPSGKSYIGVTRYTSQRRFREHKADSVRRDHLIYRAWRAHGDPVLTVLAVIDNDCLLATEIRAIDVFRTLTPFGYNSTIGGDISPALMPHVAQKIAEKARGRIKSEETRAKISVGNKGKKRTDATRALMSLAMSRRVCKPETRAKQSEINSRPERILKFLETVAPSRSVMTPERKIALAIRMAAMARDPVIRAKITAAVTGRKNTEETKEKMRAAALGKPKSAEARANMSRAATGRIFSDETKAKLSLIRTGRKHSPETIQKMKEAWDRRRLAKSLVEAEHHEIQNIECDGGLSIR